MDWIKYASDVFAFRREVAIIIAVLYAVPALRLVTFPISLGHPFFMFFNKKLGQFEHAVSWFRDTAVVAYLFFGGLWNISFGIDAADRRRIIIGAAALGLVALSALNHSWKNAARKRLLEFIRNFPTIHPGEFFAHLLCSAGGVRHRLPKRPRRFIDPANIDFRSPKGHGITLGDLIAGVWSTIWCTRLSLTALKWRGVDFLRDAASSLAVVWGSRMAQLVRAQVIIEAPSPLGNIHGLNIYLFNHMSFLDFAIVPIVMATRVATREALNNGVWLNNLPRFLIAKDHFLDNPVFHRILGIGRVAEATGMVFVERKEREESARAVVEEAAVKLAHDGIDFAIFPQGTRAVGKTTAGGERIDAGYYAVGRPARMRRDGDHLKKGASHLATSAAIVLASEGQEADVNLVPIAIKGTSVIAPRGSMRLQPNVTVHVRLGLPIVVKASDVKGIEDNSGRQYNDFVRRLHSRIDNSLKATVHIHAELERRFFEDMRMVAEPHDIEEMAIAMKPWRGEDYLVHAILDCIYACKPNDWYPLLGRLMYLIRNDAKRDEFLAFKGEVVDAIFG